MLRKSVSVRVLLCAGVLLAAACSRGDRKSVYPVTGKVLVKGRPAEGAMVFFHPRENADKSVARPQGIVASDGSFELSTYGHHDGAPAGRYVVTVVWGEPAAKGDSFKKLLLPARYGSPATSKLTAAVSEQPTDLPPFRLSY